MMSARLFSGWKLLFCLLAFFVAVFLFVPKAAAFDDPERYYDWSTSETRVNSRVLGASTTPSASPTAQPKSIQDYKKFPYFLSFTSSLSPDNPFYFIKTLQEKTALALTVDVVKREGLRLAIAGQRLAELETYAAKNNKPNATREAKASLERISQSYQRALESVTDELAKLKDQVPNSSDLLKRFEEETARQSLVLGEVTARLPEETKPSIEGAVVASEKAEDKSADFSGKPALPTDVLDRLQALKSQGLMTSEELTAIVGSKTRSEARETLRKYADSGIFPPADLKKFGEIAKREFKDDYQRAIELKKFFELKKLEEFKPDEEMVKKVQEFAKNYKSGDVVPADLRRYWLPLVRLEELQNTIRPDLIDEKLFGTDKASRDKFQEVVKRVQPRPEDILQVEKYITANPNAALDPFYERVRKIGEKFGASCGGDSRWVPDPSNSSGGYCAPNKFNAATFIPPEVKSDRSCVQVITAAKSPEGVCVVFPNSCVPDNWTKVNSCAADASDAGKVAPLVKSCPSNSHWAAISYGSEGGYCVPNITYVSYQPSTTGDKKDLTAAESLCPEKFHRNYSNGPCTPDTYFGVSPSYPTYTPGSFPSPVFPPTSCPAGYFWSGTACLSESRACGYGAHWDASVNGCTSNTPPVNFSCPTGQYPGPGGACTSENKSAEAAKCNQTGRFWTGSDCLDKAPTSADGISCPAGQSYDVGNRTCVTGCFGGVPRADMSGCRTPGECYDWCKTNPGKCSGFNPEGPRPGDAVSRESQEADCHAGGGTCVSWVNGACSCQGSSAQSSGTGVYNPSAGPNPPSGYGSCSGDQYWNGSACVSSYTQPASNSDAERTCQQAQNCSSLQSAPQPTQPPQPPPSQPTQPSSQPSSGGGDPAAMCAATPGCSWTGSTCSCTPQ